MKRILGALLATCLSASAFSQTVDESYLKLLSWRSIGPTRGGRWWPSPATR